MNGLLSTWVLVTEVHCHEYVGRVGTEFVREGFMTVELGLGVRIAVLANVGVWMSKLPEELPEVEEEAVATAGNRVTCKSLLPKDDFGAEAAVQGLRGWDFHLLLNS